MVSNAVSDLTALFMSNFKWHATTVFIARFIFLFRPSWPICWLACRKCSGAFFFLQPHRLGVLSHHLHPDWIFFWEEVKITRSLAGATGILPDFRGDNFHRSRRVFKTFIIQVSARHFPKRLRLKHK
jgi:hypothetical protein